MDHNPWVSQLVASSRLGVTEEKLEKWREVGYLKPGTHWRSSPTKQKSPWSPEVIYHLDWCKEVVSYWEEHHAPIKDIAA
tara:strand:- start:3933 stop:4172 length:240 start_codon:yes stop_codon:yes gene_type:complete